MSISPISPADNNIKQKAIKAKESVKKFILKHKTATGAAATLLASAAIVGGLIYSGKLLPEAKIQRDAQKALDNATQTYEKAMEVINAAKEKFDNIDNLAKEIQKKGDIVSEINMRDLSAPGIMRLKREDGTIAQLTINIKKGIGQIVEEFDSSNKLIRKSTIVDDATQVIDDFSGTKPVRYRRNHDALRIFTNFRESQAGEKSADTHIISYLKEKYVEIYSDYSEKLKKVGDWNATAEYSKTQTTFEQGILSKFVKEYSDDVTMTANYQDNKINSITVNDKLYKLNEKGKLKLQKPDSKD